MKTIEGRVVAECRGCRWWGDPWGNPDIKGVELVGCVGPGGGSGVELLRRCMKIPLFYDATQEGVGREFAVRAMYRETRAFVKDGSDYRGYLLTAGNFGCAHFEEGE